MGLKQSCPEVNLDFKCQPGEGENEKVASQSFENSEERCKSLCRLNADCIGFDYTIDYTTKELEEREDACRLYRANTPRIGKGKHDRTYCYKLSKA